MPYRKILLSLILILVGLTILSCYQEKVPPVDENQETHNPFTPPAWFEALIPAYRTLQAGDTEKAADLLFAAAEELPKKDWEIYLVAATLFTPQERYDQAFEAIEKSIDAGMRDNELLQSLPDFAPLRQDPRWQALGPRVLENKRKRDAAILKPKLLEELKQMWAADQAAWQSWGQVEGQLREQGKLEERRQKLAAIEALARDNQNRLAAMIEEHGWLGFKALGEDGAKFSWAIAQHAPDIFAKETFLSHLKVAVGRGDADPNHFAELADRIARDTWRKQVYGSSMSQQAPHPIDDPANVDKRRLELGLQYPVEVYASFHDIAYKRPTREQAAQEAQRSREKAQALFANFLKAHQAGDDDAANSAINQAIDFYGDLTNDQLYQAALLLAQTGKSKSETTSFQILEVLTWRRWSKRSNIQTDPKLNALRSQDRWQKLVTTLKASVEGSH